MAKQTFLEKMRQAASDILSDPEETKKRAARKAAMQTNFNLYTGSHMNQEKQGIQITDWIDGPVTYDPNGGQYFWVNYNNNLHTKMLAELRGWGGIQNMKEFKDTEGNIDMKAAGQFQDDIGKWIAEAINEKLAREAIPEPGWRVVKLEPGDYVMNAEEVSVVAATLEGYIAVIEVELKQLMPTDRDKALMVIQGLKDVLVKMNP